MAEVSLRSVAPILQVADLSRAINFYTKTLGFENRDYGMRDCTFADPDGNSIAIGEACG